VQSAVRRSRKRVYAVECCGPLCRMQLTGREIAGQRLVSCQWLVIGRFVFLGEQSQQSEIFYKRIELMVWRQKSSDGLKVGRG